MKTMVMIVTKGPRWTTAVHLDSGDMGVFTPADWVLVPVRTSIGESGERLDKNTLAPRTAFVELKSYAGPSGFAALGGSWISCPPESSELRVATTGPWTSERKVDMTSEFGHQLERILPIDDGASSVIDGFLGEARDEAMSPGCYTVDRAGYSAEQSSPMAFMWTASVLRYVLECFALGKEPAEEGIRNAMPRP